VTGTVGAYTAVVIDQETYAAAGGAVYFGPDQILSIRDVALHLLPPGGYGYDLAGREPVFEGTAFPAPNIAGRDRGLFAAPPGAGSLYLAGDLSSDPIGAVAGDFASEAAAAGGTTLVFAAGYPSDSTANQAMNNWINRLSQLGVPDVDGVALTGGADPDEIAAELADAGAIFMIGGRGDVLANQVQMLIDTGIDQILLERWQNGAPVLLDNAAAAAAGAWMSASPPPADVEIEASDSFLAGHVPIAPGLGLLPGVVFEPRFLYDYLYGRLVSHLAAHPDMVGFGIERATAVRINPDGVWVLGDMAVMVMDGRFTAHIGSGTNDAFAAVWILLDTFATGQEIPTPAPDIPFAIYLPIAIRTEN
jgi:cyanophycinase